MTIIGARTSQGKSALALQMAYDIAKQEIPVLYLSLEMYEEDVIERLFCLSQKIDNYELLTGKFKNYEKEWKEFEEEMTNASLVITDMLGKTWQEIDEYLNQLTVKPKVVIIDHLQEAKDALSKNQKEVIEEYLKKLRLMAIRDDFSVVICSQINRISQIEKSGSEPQLHHLKSSGYIEEGADIIMLLHWGWHYNKDADKNKFIINVAKNRNGRTGWINVQFRPEFYRFYDEESTDHPEIIEEINRVDWGD